MNQYDSASIKRGLLAHAEGAGFVIIHSALHAFGPDIEKFKWPILAAVRHAAEQGTTVLFPSFTFRFTRDGTFDLNNSPSETGILADWVMELNGAKRSTHPIYSFVAIGEKAGEILSRGPSTCFGKNSVFEFVTRFQDSKVILLGADWDKCTLFHFYEELFRVPYRHHKTFCGLHRTGTNSSPIETTMYVRDLKSNPQNDFSPAVRKLHERGSICKTQGGLIQSSLVSDISEVCSELLNSDKYVFIRNKSEVSQSLETEQKKTSSTNKFRLYIYGSQNNEILAATFREVWPVYLQPQSVVIDTAGFGQHRDIFFKKQVKQKKYDCVVCVERFKDLVKSDQKDGRLLIEDLEAYIDSIKELARSRATMVVVLSFSERDGGHLTHIRSGKSETKKHATLSVDEANRHLKSAIEEIPGAAFLNADSLSGEFEDVRLAFFGRIPFSQAFSRSISSATLSKVLARFGKTIRLLLVDLDNTCWGGVAGEDGIDGIRVGHDFPGNVFLEIQRRLKELSSRGVTLGIVSKNDESLVRETFKARQDFPLQLEDFIVVRANWEPKSKNIMSIAAELGLGLQNIGLLDDNPVEREEVKRTLPEVRVLPWPSDITLAPSMLSNHVYLGVWTLTEEDLVKSQSYKNRQRLIEASEKFLNRKEFLTYLNVSVFLQEVNRSNTERVIQLFAKTNQFNATGNRLSRDDIDHLGFDTFTVIASSDRFSEREIIGVVRLTGVSGLEDVVIEEFVLSCRALGKGIEEKVLDWILTMARTNGKKNIKAVIKKLERNEPIIKFYEKNNLSLTPTAVFPDSSVNDTWIDCIALYDERD